MTDLLDHFETPSLECLNAKPDKPLINALKKGYREDDGLVLESDTDEQLLIHIPFNHAVRISGLIIKSTAAPDQAPKTIKLFINQPTIGFGEASDSAGVESFEVTEAQLSGEVITLRPVKFARVNCLTIFVESNQEDEDTTIIQKIAILGQSGDKMDVGDIKDVAKAEEQG